MALKPALLLESAAFILVVRRGLVGCGVAKLGAACLSWVRRGSVGCGVAQLVARRAAVPEFESRLGGSLLSEQR